jgi:hypothetical protein
MPIPETVARLNARVTDRVTDPDCRLVPGPVRVALGLLDVSDFLSMRPAPAHF